MTEQVIAAELKVAQTTINRIRRRKVTPVYDLGKRLVDMATALERQAAPKKRKRAA